MLLLVNILSLPCAFPGTTKLKLTVDSTGVLNLSTEDENAGPPGWVRLIFTRAVRDKLLNMLRVL